MHFRKYLQEQQMPERYRSRFYSSMFSKIPSLTAKHLAYLAYWTQSPKQEYRNMELCPSKCFLQLLMVFCFFLGTYIPHSQPKIHIFFHDYLALPCKDNPECTGGTSCVADYCQPTSCSSTGQCVHGQVCYENGVCVCKSKN